MTQSSARIGHLTAVFALVASFGLMESWPEIATQGRSLILLSAVVLAAMVGGPGPGLVTTVGATAILFDNDFHWPRNAAQNVRLLLFVGLGAAITVASGLLRRAARQREEWIEHETVEREAMRRREMERILRETDRRLQALVESNVIGVLLLEGETVTDANRAFLDMLGLAKREVVGRTLTSLSDAADRERDLAAFDELARSGRFEPYEKRLRANDGLPHHALVAGARLPESTNRWLAFALDLEDRKRHEAEREDLLAREQSARRAAETVSEHATFLADATAMLSASFDERVTLQRVIELAVPLLADYASIELVRDDGRIERVAATQTPALAATLGDRLWSFVPTLETAANPVAKTIRSGRTEWVPWTTPEWRHEIATNEEHAALLERIGPRSFVCVPIALRGRVYGALTLCFGPGSERLYTFAEVRVAEELGTRCAVAVENAHLYAEVRAARAEAEGASRAREEFLATISHELRTPMNTMSILVNLLRSGRLAEERRAEAFETIQRNMRVQLRLLEDLLDTSRVISGKLKIELETTAIGDSVLRAVESVRPAIEQKRIRLDVDREGEDVAVRADPDRIEQVLVNLFGNAIKFSPEEGRIRVRVAREGAYAVVVVADEGAGIPPDLLPHVFEPFRGASARNDGLGLGLAIAYRIVTLHGGDIRAESEGPGRGSRFTMRLPALSERREEAPLHGLRLLVATSSTDFPRSTGASLAALGADVTIVASAAEAFDHLSFDRPDALVTESPIPDLDDLEIVRRLRRNERESGTPPLPVVTISSATRPAGDVESLPGSALVWKPIRPEVLAETIRGLLADRPPACDAKRSVGA